MKLTTTTPITIIIIATHKPIHINIIGMLFLSLSSVFGGVAVGSGNISETGPKIKKKILV